MAISILLFAAILSACHALSKICPSEEKIGPNCICKELGDGPMMMCSNLMTPEDMISPIIESENYDMFSLAIQDSTLQYIPDKIFLRTTFKKVSVYPQNALLGHNILKLKIANKLGYRICCRAALCRAVFDCCRLLQLISESTGLSV